MSTCNDSILLANQESQGFYSLPPTHPTRKPKTETHEPEDVMLISKDTMFSCCAKILAVVDDATMRKAECKIEECGLKPPAYPDIPNMLILNSCALKKFQSLNFC